ncbi:hypothetical protein ELI24_11780 [Rhizobium ruizarguesonis]|jgi:hypothetical protein|uniref:Uncharacterized protein n=1 Tax=Rhizobium ruizarguesonis TaxID=2081791 RepID=A0AB38I621_9HYPH|nr:hypothetical protein [Rhizobium ruizarguesonis]NEI07301.1 hypothetical protein [Rhizobium ruizarguesonis]NEI29872.1 hypothetical protein [Rhizobium ruizarguesonis]TAT83967.1 hypothetical protein ELI52_10975 [Rhizobium ruizarguesonis]TAV98999.1 hypothetical protein ELI24_11780 [Rhizobium ruizarguesonis]TAW16381.1 hypothetical protein ELI25_11470 [Rhizobium ruizarguesonis]
MLKTFLVASITILIAGWQTQAAAIRCERIVKGRAVEATNVERDSTGNLTVSTEKIDFVADENGPLEKSKATVIFHSLTHENGGDGPFVSTFLLDSRYNSPILKKELLYSPITYYLNWGRGTLSSVYLDYTGKANLLEDWTCGRLD